MKPSTKDQIKGELHEIKGKAKEKVGQITNNPNMAAEGQSEKLVANVPNKTIYRFRVRPLPYTS